MWLQLETWYLVGHQTECNCSFLKIAGTKIVIFKSTTLNLLESTDNRFVHRTNTLSDQLIYSYTFLVTKVHSSDQCYNSKMPWFDAEELKVNDITCSLEKTHFVWNECRQLFGPWFHGRFNTKLLPETTSHLVLTFPEQLAPYCLSCIASQ